MDAIPTSPVARLHIHDNIAVIVVESGPVNAISQAVREALFKMTRWADAQPEIDAIVIRCGGATFFAGADIREFGKPPQEPGLSSVVVEAIEDSVTPVIAAIHGTALGGGMEVALACHYRIALASAKVGLPEVKLGLLPGAGGTQRLPRVIPVPKALEMITGGSPISAAEAFEIGLIDEIVEGDLAEAAISTARRIANAKERPVRSRDRTDHIEAARQDPQLFDRFLKDNDRRFRGQAAPKAIVRAIRAAVESPFGEGRSIERELFLELSSGPQSPALRHAFFAEREAAKIPGLSPSTPIREIRSVGIIGAGTMGSGIAINFLLAGIPVTIVETAPEALERGAKTIRDTIDRNVASGRTSPDDGVRAKSLLTPELAFNALSDVDLVVEAAFETMDVKRSIFAQLDSIAREDAILATNTSYLDVDAIAATTSRPQNVVGLHFFSPANIMRLLEIVRAEKTADDVLATALSLAKRIGKIPVVAGVCHGFIGNRMLRVRREAANALLLQGVSPYAIDRVVEEFGMPMGPFRMQDLAGLDLGWSADASCGATIQDRLCELGRRGQKSGAGYYDYDEKRRPSPSQVVEQVISAFASEKGAATHDMSDADVLNALVYPMINEGFRILDEGKAYRASDIDTVWIHGYGWPAYTGGPIYYAQQHGLARIQAGLEEIGQIVAEGLRATAAG